MAKVHFDGQRYRLEGHRGEAGFRDILKWQMNGQRAKWPRHVTNNAHPAPPQRVAGNAITTTWVGHSTVLIQTAGLNILTDPLLSERASPVPFIGPRRVRAAAFQAHQMPPIDLLLLSHNHYDHMDLAALKRIAAHHKPLVVTPKGNARFIRSAMRGVEIRELLWDETTQFGPATIHLTPALHWSKRGLFDSNTALWGGFVVAATAAPVYFAGDTGFGDGHIFADIKARYGAPRLSLLPIGAYEPRWFMSPQHMNPDDAVKAHLLLGSGQSLAIHHGTIQLTDEAMDAPAAALAVALSAHGIDPARFLVPDAGEPVTIA